jgi:hypothetical protein
MSHYAKIENNLVVQVIVAEQDFIEQIEGEWIQTSYTNRIRKNYAGIGMIYDRERDAFYTQQPYSSWILNEDTCIWEAPTPYPTDGNFYYWDEDTLEWFTND